MMFINDLDVLNANTNATSLYRPQTTTAANTIQSYDTALHLQSNTNTLTFACQQKGFNLAHTASAMPQTTISYSTSRHDLMPTSNIYTYSDTQQQTTASAAPTTTQNHAISNLIPLNITIFNPALSCNYNPAGMQNPILAATPQFPQVTTIPNFANYNAFPQKYVYKTKAEEYSNTLSSDYQYGVVSAKSTVNKYYSKINHSNGNNSSQPYYINPKRILQQQDNLVPTNTTTSTTQPLNDANSVFFTNNTNTGATTILTPLNPLDIPAQPAIIPIRNAIQPINSNTRLVGIKKRKKRFKKPIELRKVLPKNSLMLLHELIPNIEYRFVKQSGPIHKPIFTMSVDISEKSFEGVGKTKKEARMMAAEKALKFLMEFPEYIQKYKSTQTLNTSVNKNINDENIDSNSKDFKIDDEGLSANEEQMTNDDNDVNNIVDKKSRKSVSPILQNELYNNTNHNLISSSSSSNTELSLSSNLNVNKM